MGLYHRAIWCPKTPEAEPAGEASYGELSGELHVTSSFVSFVNFIMNDHDDDDGALW